MEIIVRKARSFQAIKKKDHEKCQETSVIHQDVLHLCNKPLVISQMTLSF
jgi:hypothetical protein